LLASLAPGRQTGLNGATPPREKPHLFGLRLGFDSPPRHLGLSRVYTECGDALPASVLIGCSQTVVRLPEPPHPAGATSSENAVEIALFGGEGGVGGDASRLSRRQSDSLLLGHGGYTMRSDREVAVMASRREVDIESFQCSRPASPTSSACMSGTSFREIAKIDCKHKGLLSHPSRLRLHSGSPVVLTSGRERPSKAPSRTTEEDRRCRARPLT